MDRFRTRSRWEVGVLRVGWNVLLLWSVQYDGITIDKCWALSSLIFYLFFVFCWSYISSHSNYHGKWTAFLFQHFFLPSFLPYLLCFLRFQTFYVIYFFFPYSFILYFVRKQLPRGSNVDFFPYTSKVLDLMYQSPTDLTFLPKVIIMTRENHHHSFPGFLVRRRDQTSRRAYYKCLKYT